MAVATPREMAERYQRAEIELLEGGKDVQFGGRRVVMADLPQIREGRIEWERRANALERRGRPGYSLARFE